MMRLIRYGQVETMPTEALSGRTMAATIYERSIGVEYYSYPAWPTYEQAQAAIAGHIQEATDRGFTVYDSVVKTLDDGTFMPVLKLIPPSGDVPYSLSDTWARVDPTALMTKQLGGEEEPVEEKTSIWPWALAGGGALVVLIIAGVAMSKK